MSKINVKGFCFFLKQKLRVKNSTNETYEILSRLIDNFLNIEAQTL